MPNKFLYYTACLVVVVVSIVSMAVSVTLVYKTHKAVERIEVNQSRTSDATPTDEEIRAWMQDCGQRRQKLLAEGHEAKPCG